MTTVQQVLHAKSGPVLSVSPDATVYDALTLMARHDIGALVVLEAGALRGMFSERDYARKVTLYGRSSRTLSVADIMTREVVSVPAGGSVDECMALMTDHRIRHLPVLDGGDVVGMISIGDVVKAQLDEQRFHIQQLEHYIAS